MKKNNCQYHLVVQPTPKSVPKQWCGSSERDSDECCFPDCEVYKELAPGQNYNQLEVK